MWKGIECPTAWKACLNHKEVREKTQEILHSEDLPWAQEEAMEMGKEDMAEEEFEMERVRNHGQTCRDW